jgi:hypothetical protein
MLVTSSLVSLPSLGVSSLDLGRTGLRAAPFISLAGTRVRLRHAAALSPDNPSNLLRSHAPEVGERAVPGRLLGIAMQYNEMDSCVGRTGRHSAAARLSSSKGSAAKTFADMSASVRTSFWKSLLLARFASSR